MLKSILFEKLLIRTIHSIIEIHISILNKSIQLNLN